jgi:hypothetical protein
MRKTLKLTLTIAMVGVAALTFWTVAASATSGAHFFSTSESINNSGALVVSWDEAGVGQATVNYTISADGTATYACINGGGNHPKATNKETVAGPVSGGGTFPVRNGQTTSSITVQPPGPGSFSCPSGQSLVLASVSYSNIVLTDTGNGDTANVSGTASRTFFNV